MELSQFDLHYRPKVAIKGQVIVDFISEFSYQPDQELEQLASEVIQETVRNLKSLC